MLSKATVEFLKPLEYRADAERMSCILPLGGIYWNDEIPDFKHLFEVPEEDRNLILRLFGIRFQVWDGHQLSDDDQQFWDVARSQVPDYAMFRRLTLSAEDRKAQEEAEQELLSFFEVLLGEADNAKIEIGEHGLSTFSVSIDLTKKANLSAEKLPWWKRLLGWFAERRA